MAKLRWLHVLSRPGIIICDIHESRPCSAAKLGSLTFLPQSAVLHAANAVHILCSCLIVIPGAWTMLVISHSAQLAWAYPGLLLNHGGFSALIL